MPHKTRASSHYSCPWLLKLNENKTIGRTLNVEHAICDVAVLPIALFKKRNRQYHIDHKRFPTYKIILRYLNLKIPKLTIQLKNMVRLSLPITVRFTITVYF